MKVRILLAVFLCLAAGVISAQGYDALPEMRGDAAIAEKYLLWAKEAIAEGHWGRARAALERAADFADVSSDISYLTALARFKNHESAGSVLAALDQAISAGAWIYYSEAEARLVQADQLIMMRRYSEALDSLAASVADGGYNADAAYLRLAALKGMKRNADFRLTMRETLERYPRDTRHLHMLFDFALENKIAPNDPLMETAFRRLPFLLSADPELAWKAAMLADDEDEARRLTSDYRSGRRISINPHSIVPALNLGLLFDEDAADELMKDSPDRSLDKGLFVRVWELLRSEEGREHLAGKLDYFSGVMTDDEDRDGFADSRAVYRQGVLQEYYYDADQDGLDEIFIIFESGSPRWALVTPFTSPQVQIFWENYPFVQRAVQGNEIWLFGPGEFRYAPIGFEEIGASQSAEGLLYPRREYGSRELTRRMFSLAAASVYCPGIEFEGSTERVYLHRGIPIRSETTLNGLLVSVTEFQNGSPIVQRLDLDADGTMETIRRFRRITAAEAQTGAPDYRPFIRSSESNRNGSSAASSSAAFGSGAFSSAEMYRSDGSVVYIWDFDGDGVREYYLASE